MDWQSMMGWLSAALIVALVALWGKVAVDKLRTRSVKPSVKEARAALLTLIEFLPPEFPRGHFVDVRDYIAERDMPIPGVDE